MVTYCRNCVDMNLFNESMVQDQSWFFVEMTAKEMAQLGRSDSDRMGCDCCVPFQTGTAHSQHRALCLR